MFLPVVVEYLREYARMTVEEILVEDGVVIGQGFGQPRQPKVRSLILDFALLASCNLGPLKYFCTSTRGRQFIKVSLLRTFFNRLWPKSN